MRFRNAALLAAIVSVFPFLYPTLYASYARFYSYYVRNGQLSSVFTVTFGNLLDLLVPAVFFVFVCGEALGKVRAETRATAATFAAVLAGLGAAISLYGLVGTIGLIWHPELLDSYPFHSIPLLTTISLVSVAWHVLWVAFVFGFARKKNLPSSRAIPMLAVTLAVFTAYTAVWGKYLDIHNRPADFNGALLSWHDAISVLSWGALFLFFVVVWKRWKPESSVHQNVVC